MAFLFRTEPIDSVHMYFYLSLRRVGQLCSSKSFGMERGYYAQSFGVMTARPGILPSWRRR